VTLGFSRFEHPLDGASGAGAFALIPDFVAVPALQIIQFLSYGSAGRFIGPENAVLFILIDDQFGDGVQNGVFGKFIYCFLFSSHRIP
jgi:hypothetical protein